MSDNDEELDAQGVTAGQVVPAVTDPPPAPAGPGAELERGPAQRDVMSAGAEGQAGGSVAAHAYTRTVTGRNGGTLTPITSANAREMANRRWERYGNAARKAAAEAAGVSTSVIAYGEMVKAQAGLALTGVKGSTPAFVAVSRAIGAFADRRDQPRDQAGAAVTLTVSGDAAQQFLAGLVDMAARARGE